MKKFYIFLIVASSVVFAVHGDNSGEVSFALIPTANMPLGESSQYFSYGAGGVFSFTLVPSGIPLVGIKVETDYNYTPLVTQDAVSLFSARGGFGLNIGLLKWLKIFPYGTAGYYYGLLMDGSGRGGGNLSVKGGLSIDFYFSPYLSLGLDGYYLYDRSFFSVAGASLSFAYHIPIGAAGKKPVKEKKKEVVPPKPAPLKTEPVETTVKGEGRFEISSIKLNPVFPVLFKHYNSFPLGSVVIHNGEPVDAKDITVSFYVEKYMDNPKECAKIGSLKAGGDTTVNLYALFSDSVLEITEGTKVSSKIILNYSLGDKRFTVERTAVLDIYDRNATTWDDNRKAAAFVTAKDPSVLEFSKKVVGWTRGVKSRAVNSNLSSAIGLHEALRLYGMSYVVDPKTPYKEFSKKKLAVDFLQFPRQTLKYSAGDCDDLSILYSALLESVGIETAFITIPGHIFMAFSLNMNPDKARKSFLRPDELIFTEGKTWLPVEVTMVNDSFLKAWEEGAKEWRENRARNQAKLYPIHDCWKEYAPVGLPGAEAELTLPDKLKVVNAFQREIITYIDREIYPKVSKLQGLIRKSGNNIKYINKLGVLYARYGLIDKATLQFERILKKEEYVPALINMGNIKYLNKDVKGALEYYKRAQAKAPNNPKVLLCIARVNHDLENYGLVKVAYEKLKTVDPALAEQFSYLALRGEEASRAAEVSAAKEVIVWDEE